MGGGLRKSAKGLDEVVGTETSSIIERASEQQFSQLRAAGDGGNATFGAETDLNDPAVGDPQGELEDVATDRVFKLSTSVSASEFADISRILEMIENLGRVHEEIVSRDRVTGE